MSNAEELAEYKAIARILLLDENGAWKRGTFLINPDGKLNEHYRGLAFLALELPTAEDALDTFLTRSRLGDPQFKLKGHFLLDLIKAAANQGLIGQVTERKERVQLSIPANNWINQAIDQLPAIARYLLTETNEDGKRVWRHNTFLHKADGSLARPFAKFTLLLKGKEPDDAIKLLFQRESDDSLYQEKGHFIRAVARAGKEIGSIPSATEVVAQIPLMAPRGIGS